MAAAVEVPASSNGHVEPPCATTPAQEKVEVVSPVEEQPEKTISKEAQKEITEKAEKGVEKINAEVPFNKEEELEEQSEEAAGTEEEEVKKSEAASMQEVATEDVASKEEQEEGVPIEKPIKEEAPGEGGSNEPAASPDAIATTDQQAPLANSTTEAASAEATTEDIRGKETTKPAEEVARDAHTATGTTMSTA